MAYRKTFLWILLSSIFAALVLAVPPQAVRAQSSGDLVSAVNALRSSYGLPPYEVDGGLMSSAQSHSDYMASIGSLTHTGADGLQPGQRGVTENICGGQSVSAQSCVSQFWTDQLHMQTMVGFSTGRVGAGLAVKDGVNYYTLHVVRTGTGTNISAAPVAPVLPAGAAQAPSATVPPEIVPVVTATTGPDGKIIHEVQSGQSPWSIATSYGITIQDLAALNNLDPAAPVLYPGQKLLIRQAPTPTLTVPPTQTAVPPTRTPRPTATATPVRPTRTPIPTLTPTRAPLVKLPTFDGPAARPIGLVLVVVCSVGLLAMAVYTIRSRGRD